MNNLLPDNVVVRLANRCRIVLRAASGCESLVVATSLAVFAAVSVLPPQTAFAQQPPSIESEQQLLLAADELIYDNDNETVTAIGNVQLDYEGRNVVADRVTYNQQSRRVKAFGNVELVERNGDRIYAQEVDISDDFAKGFVNSLRMRTTDNTRMAAESAERVGEETTVFHNGVYTACEPCRERPDRAPLWQIKAQKIIHNGLEKTVTYHHPRFELFGLPILYLPYFSHLDATVKRKSGFLMPSFGNSTEVGLFGSQSYFWVTGDSHDLTLTGTYFQKQGALGEVKWRHQLENGYYEFKVAGIEQENPDEFAASSADSKVTSRAMLGSHGTFDINPRWTFGWNVLAQTDNNFSRTYKIDGYTASAFTNELYLRGLHDRSYFDLSAKRYLTQNSRLVGTGQAFSFESEQPTILPTLDYNYVKNEDLTGGEVSLDVNLAGISRSHLSSRTGAASTDTRTHGIDGETARISADLGWKKTHITSAGLAFTPSWSLRGDWTTTSGFSASATTPGATAVSTGDHTRLMPTAGLEVRYPLLASTPNASHVIEPIAQVFLRPDLAFGGVLPNEDAQSMVFDASNLFERDKFSGYDRIESGTRANIGLRYSAIFDNGVTLNGIAGQSFHIAGDNSYARDDDLANAGEESGLEKDQSDYVASLSAITPSGFTVTTQGRFDQDDLNVERAEAIVSYSSQQFSASTNYTFIESQPDYGFSRSRQQVGFGARVKLAENWDLFGGAQYNIESDTVVKDRIGLSYHDECFTLSLAFSETRSAATSKPSRLFSFSVSLRTLGDFQESISNSQFEQFTDGSADN